MNATRFETLFCLRYAVRVLERYARLWHRLDASLRLLAIFSGTAAFGAVVAQSAAWTIVGGIIFALLQAAEFALAPARREQEALAARGLYAEVLARQQTLSDEALEAAYQGISAKDEVIVWESLRRLAYNDVVEERGGDPTACYRLSRLERAVALIA